MKNILAILMTILTIVGCKTEKPLEDGMYRIKGTISGITDGVIYVSRKENKERIEIKKGEFRIEQQIKEPVIRIYLSKNKENLYMDAKEGLSLYVEPGIMDLQLDYNDFSNSKLTGSKAQDDLYHLDSLTKKAEKGYEKVLADFATVAEEYKKAIASGASEEDLKVIKYKYNECREKLAPMRKKKEDITLQFIKDNPKSYINVESLTMLLRNLKYKEAKALYDQLNPDYLDNEQGKRLTKNIKDMQKGIPGTIAGSFNTVDINGDPLKLDDFKGKYLLIDFWASWCVPCRKGNPHLIELFKKYNPKGLEILGVSDDDRNHDAWRKAVKEDGIGIWHHVLRGLKVQNGRIDFTDTSTDISDGYNIGALPTKILVGPDGVIVGRYGAGGGNDEDMDRDLAALFDK